MVRSWSPALAALLASSLLFHVSPSRADTVILKDGKRLEGKVKLQELGKYVVLELPNGAQKTVMWDDLKEIEISAPGAADPKTPEAPPATQPEAPATAPAESKKPKHKKKLDKTEISGEATKDGATVGIVHDCGDGEPACHEEATVKVEAGDIKAKYDAVEDCATEEGEVCTKTTAATAGKDGLKIGITKESAKRVTGPKSGATQVGLSANFLYATAETLEMTGLTAGINVRFLNGGQFPGESGGSWFGFFLEPSAQLTYSRTVIETPERCFGGQCTGGKQQSTSGAAMLNATAGIQWMSFGALDKKTIQQSGWGFAVGGQLGAYIPFEGDATKTYGAALNIVMPKYNPGTGTFVTEQLNLFLLPTSDMFFLLIGAQKSWG